MKFRNQGVYHKQLKRNLYQIPKDKVTIYPCIYEKKKKKKKKGNTVKRVDAVAGAV